MPGTSAEDLRQLDRKSRDVKNLGKYLAAHHRKKGNSVEELARP